jgi:hypothetical protein
MNSAGLMVVAVLVASLLGGSAHAAATAAPAANITFAANVMSATTVPGGAAQILVAISNAGVKATPAGKPIGFTIAAPTGFRFVGASNVEHVPGFGGPSGVGGHWACHASRRNDATCQFGSSVRAGGAIAVLARFDVAGSVRPGGAAGFRVTGEGVAAGRNSHATMRVARGAPSPSLFVELTGTSDVRGDRPAVEIIDILNAGSGPAVSTGGRPAVELANLLPASVVGSWSASGRGWTCTGAAGSSPSCTNSTTVPVGKLAPRLRITYELDPTRLAGLHLETGGKPSFQTWTIHVTGNGGAKPHTSPTPAQLTVSPPPGALLVPTAVAARGLQELMPGSQTTVHLSLTNIGGAATSGRIGLGGRIPAGTSIVSVGGPATWSCQGGTTATPVAQEFGCRATSPVSVPVRGTLLVELVVKAALDAKPGAGSLVLSALADNEIAAAKPRATTLPLLILEGNAGFPGLTLLRAVGNASLVPALDGAPAKLLSGGLFTERLDVRDAGGAAIAAGSRAELTQQLGAGSTIRSIRTPPGWRCSGTTRLSCSIRFSSALEPAKILEGPTVVISAGAPTRTERSWTASIRLVQAGAPRASRLPVLVTIDHGVPHLVPNFTNVRVPTAGGTGTFGLGVRNDGNGATVAPVQLGIHLPPGVRLVKLATTGWSCVTAATSARCTSPGPAAAGSHLPHLRLSLAFAKRTANKNVTLSAHASNGARDAPASARAAIDVTPRHALRAVIREPNTIAFADQPLVRANQKLIATVLTLEGDGSGGSGLGLNYHWTQRCLTDADAKTRGSHCSGVTLPVKWLGQRTAANVRFATPQVTKPTMLVFNLVVSDGSARSSAFVRLKVLPLPSASKGFTIRNAHPKVEKPLGPATERRALPKPAEPLKSPKKKTKPKRLAAGATPTDTNPTTTTTATTTAATTTSATTTTSAATTTAPTTTTAPVLPPVFCQLVREALDSSGSFSGSIAGGVSIHLKGVRVTGTACDPGTVVHFSNSSFSVHSYLDASGVSGSISQDGLTLTSGTLTGPDAWNAPTFTLSGGGLSIPFDGGQVALSGTIKAAGFAFVPLPSGWHGSTSVTFDAGSDGTSVSVSTTATGPQRLASPSSQAPTATVHGSIANNGTFSLSVDVQRIVQLEGHAVNVAGHVKRSAPAGAISFALEGSLPDPFSIVPGLEVSELHVKLAPTDESLNLTASGLIDLSVPSGKIGVHVKLAYDDPANWSLAAQGVGDTTWEPVPGLKLAAKDFSGAIIAKDDKYELTLHVAPSEAWKPTSSITASNLELDLSNVCPNTGAPCPEDASIFLNLKGDVSLAMPVVGTLSAKIAGTLALPSGDFSVEAALTRPLSIGGAITIDNARVLIQHGMGLPPEQPSAEMVDGGQFRVDLTGGISVPGIGKLPTVHASFSSKGWAVAVPLGGFSLPGASGDGSKLGNTVLGWASYATTMQIVDPETKAITKIPLTANAFKLTGDFATPAWLSKMLKLPGNIEGRATGVIDPVQDIYSLRMEFSVPGQPYLYGSASTATNVRLKSTYFEIERQGAEFNVALGGSATMTVAGSGSVSASSVDVGLALSYAVTSQTVAGTLTFTSPDGWKNAFGTRELTLYDLAIAFQFHIPSLTPAVGFGARAVLPPTMREQLGVVNGARTTLVANISLTNPCLGIQVDDPTGSGREVMSIGSGALTAKAFELQIAPTGCTVGQFKYAAGISLRFDGKVAGVTLAINARVGLSPFGFDATADLGEFVVGGMTVKKTHVEVSLTVGKLKIAFAGGVEVFGTNVDLSGTVKREGSNVVADFTGTLDKLALGGEAVTATDLKVTTHVEVGSKNVLQFEARGKITLLGSVSDGKFSLSLANGQLNAAKADIATVVKVGGPAGLTLDGTFKIDYSKTSPLAIDATVKAKAGSFEVASAAVTVRSGYLSVSANFAVGNVFSAKIEGAAYYGTVPAGTTMPTATGGKVVAKTGDFYLSANNIQLTLAGFRGSGTVWFGRSAGVVGASLNGTIQVLGTGTSNTVTVAGSIEGNGNFSLAGSAALDLAGFKPTVAVSVKKIGSAVSVSGAADIPVLGSRIALQGDFRYDAGQFRFRMNGSGTLVVGGYTLANSTVRFSNFPEDAGFSAQVSLRAGSTLSADGRVNFEPGGRFSFSANASLNLRAYSVNGNVKFANYYERCEPQITWKGYWPVITMACKNVDSSPTLTANATINRSGFSFALSMTVAADGSFNATARTPVAGEAVKSTGTLSLLVVKGYAEIAYHMQLTVKSSSPYIAVDGAGNAAIKYSYWTFWDGWSSWKTLVGAGVSLQTDPFKACAYGRVAGSDVGGCIT